MRGLQITYIPGAPIVEHEDGPCLIVRANGSLALHPTSPNATDLEAIIEAQDPSAVEGHAWILDEFVDMIASAGFAAPTGRREHTTESEAGWATLCIIKS